jgi:hypothetical protein
MNFVKIWDIEEWSDSKALTVALESLNRNGRETPLVEWINPEAHGSDLLALAEDLQLSDRELVALIIAYANENGFIKQLDAHARRTVRRSTQNDNNNDI